jgi:hypothetical protein
MARPCPLDHKHTASGKPLRPGCPGRVCSRAVCTCGRWEFKDHAKGYFDESPKRHLALPADAGPADLLRPGPC